MHKSLQYASKHFWQQPVMGLLNTVMWRWRGDTLTSRFNKESYSRSLKIFFHTQYVMCLININVLLCDIKQDTYIKKPIWFLFTQLCHLKTWARNRTQSLYFRWCGTSVDVQLLYFEFYMIAQHQQQCILNICLWSERKWYIDLNYLPIKM